MTTTTQLAPDPEALAVLRRARAAYAARGRCVGRYTHYPTGKVCVEGALMLAGMGRVSPVPPWMGMGSQMGPAELRLWFNDPTTRARRVLVELLGVPEPGPSFGLARWHDRRATFDDAIALLDLAVALLESAGAPEAAAGAGLLVPA